MKTHRLFFLVILLTALVISSAVAQDDVTVYVTKTGSKYHTAGCGYLSRSSIPMKLSEAAARYSPCSRCNPPTLSGSSSKTSTQLKKLETQTAPKASTSHETMIGSTPTGKTLYQGPRGGIYHYSKSGKKVYHKKK